MSGSDQTVVMMLSVLLVTTAIVLGAFAIGLAGIWKTKARSRSKREDPLQEIGELGAPCLFDRPSRWIAVKCSSIQKVQAALELHNAKPCPLSEGLAKLQEKKLFISPPIRGWILVIGGSLPEAAEDPDRLYHFLMRIANVLGSVQYFSANRVLNHHAWVRIENNRVYRAYAWAGETLWNQGDLTAAERELEMKCHDYGEAPLPFPFAARDSHLGNAEKVLQLAAKWSVDPLAVNTHPMRAGFGIAGDLSRTA